MSKPITNPRREPPLHYVCAQCGESSEDFAGLITEDAHRGYGELGEWECGCCGGQEWRKPKAAKAGKEAKE